VLRHAVVSMPDSAVICGLILNGAETETEHEGDPSVLDLIESAALKNEAIAAKKRRKELTEEDEKRKQQQEEERRQQHAEHQPEGGAFGGALGSPMPMMPMMSMGLEDDDDEPMEPMMFGRQQHMHMGGVMPMQPLGRPTPRQLHDFPRVAEMKRKASAVEQEDPTVKKLRAAAAAVPRVATAAAAGGAQKKMRSIRSFTDSDESEDEDDDDDDDDDSSDDSDDGFEFEDDDVEFSFCEQAEQEAEKYTLLTPEQFDQERKRAVRATCEEMGIGPAAASAVLRAFNWDARVLRRAWCGGRCVLFGGCFD
jgi:hypothetical protein